MNVASLIPWETRTVDHLNEALGWEHSWYMYAHCCNIRGIQLDPMFGR